MQFETSDELVSIFMAFSILYNVKFVYKYQEIYLTEGKSNASTIQLLMSVLLDADASLCSTPVSQSVSESVS